MATIGPAHQKRVVETGATLDQVSTVAHFFELFIAEPEKMGDFVDHGQLDFLKQLLAGGTEVFQRFLIDVNRIGIERRFPDAALGERHPQIDPKQRLIRGQSQVGQQFLAGPAFNRNDNIVQITPQLLGDAVNGLLHQAGKGLGADSRRSHGYGAMRWRQSIPSRGAPVPRQPKAMGLLALGSTRDLVRG